MAAVLLQTIGEGSAFTWGAAVLLIALAFALGLWARWLTLKISQQDAKIATLEETIADLRKRVLFKHWFANYMNVFLLENHGKGLNVPKVSDIQSQE